MQTKNVVKNGKVKQHYLRSYRGNRVLIRYIRGKRAALHTSRSRGEETEVGFTSENHRIRA